MGAAAVSDVSWVDDSLEADAVKSLDDAVTAESSAELVAETGERDGVPSPSELV